jgi:hypothetical protein
MSKDLIESLDDLELARHTAGNAAELARRYGLPLETAERIVEMARSIDQAHAIAELMR